MAKIDWTENFLLLLHYYIDNANEDYGKTTAIKWSQEIATFENRLRSFPESYPPEELLRNRKVLYRRCQIMNHRFKLIYTYDEINDIVHLIDIWDTKRKPSALIRRIK